MSKIQESHALTHSRLHAASKLLSIDSIQHPTAFETVAVLAHATGQPGLAGVAAQRATEIGPDENFPSLVAKLTDIGQGERMVELVREGAEKTRTILFAE